jgi:hypothetical protein
VLLAALAGGWLVALSPAAAGPRAGPEAPCQPLPRRTVHPLELERGSEITIQLGLQARCDVITATRPLHLALLVDASDTMTEAGWTVLRGALVRAVSALPMDRLPYLRIGVVSNDRNVKTYLTQSVEQVVAGLNNIKRAPSCLECGLDEAWTVLRNSPLGRPAENPREVVLLVAGGPEQAGCEKVRLAASDAKARGIVLVTAWTCTGATCERQCLSEIASGERFAFRAWGWEFLQERLSELVKATGPFHPIRGVSVADDLHDGLLYTHGGAPNRVLGNRLEWELFWWPPEGLGYVYHARAVACGTSFPTSEVRDGQSLVTATLSYDTAFWDVPPSTLTFENPRLTVCLPTATPPPTATAVPSSPPATPTPSPSPTPTETVRSWRAYVPLAGRFGCMSGPVEGPLDVVLAVDVSGSMKQPDVPGYERRWDAAAAIARALLAQVAPTDLVGVLAFYGIPEAEPFEWLSPLTADRQAAGEALDRLPKRDGSRLDRAIDAARAELVGPRSRPTARAVLWLLTDGEPNQAQRSAIEASADAARAAGVDSYAVGIGQDADAALLARITGSPARVLLTRGMAPMEPATLAGSALRCLR